MAQKTKNLFEFSAKFELRNFELSDGFLKDPVANVHGTKNMFVLGVV